VSEQRPQSMAHLALVEIATLHDLLEEILPHVRVYFRIVQERFRTTDEHDTLIEEAITRARAVSDPWEPRAERALEEAQRFVERVTHLYEPIAPSDPVEDLRRTAPGLLRVARDALDKAGTHGSGGLAPLEAVEELREAGYAIVAELQALVNQLDEIETGRRHVGERIQMVAEQGVRAVEFTREQCREQCAVIADEVAKQMRDEHDGILASVAEVVAARIREVK